MEQILLNLLTNAAKYSYPETEILVEIVPGPGEVAVLVTNQGPGIPEEDRAELFTRFHRTRAAVEEKVPGLGLGLYISKTCCAIHCLMASSTSSSPLGCCPTSGRQPAR